MNVVLNVRILAALALPLLTGCSVFTSPISRHEKASQTDAYLYGRFSVSASSNIYGLYPIIGLDFACKQNAAWYSIGFSKEDPLQVIKIPGGDTCSLVRISYARPGGLFVVKTELVPTEVRAPIRFEPGTAYYLGDFSSTSSAFDLGTRVEMEWRLTGVSDRYARTTANMKSAFHGMSMIPTENKTVQWPAEYW
jgi:hypothetical protein